MAAAVASSHSHRSAGRSPVASPLCGPRVRVDPAPACVVATSREQDAANKDASGRRHHRGPSDDEPRRTTTPSVIMRRRWRDGDREASPDRKRRRRERESATRASYYRKDDTRRRDREVKRKEGGRARDRAREGARKRSSSRSDERRVVRAHPSAADDRKWSPEKEVERNKAEDTDDAEEARRRRDELQRMREEARRELDKVVRTVWFNDPYISPLCVLNTMPRWTLRTTSEVEEGEVF